MMSHDEIEDIVDRSTRKTLAVLGLDVERPDKVRADFAHLRKWRESVERVERLGWGAVITTIVTGALGAMWVGLQAMLHK